MTGEPHLICDLRMHVVVDVKDDTKCLMHWGLRDNLDIAHQP